MVDNMLQIQVQNDNIDPAAWNAFNGLQIALDFITYKIKTVNFYPHGILNSANHNDCLWLADLLRIYLKQLKIPNYTCLLRPFTTAIKLQKIINKLERLNK